MISLIEVPQRADISVKYIINSDMLIVKVNDIEDIFDFTGLDEGIAEEIITQVLPINPIISAEKSGDTVNIQIIRFYGEDEKEVFENGTD